MVMEAELSYIRDLNTTRVGVARELGRIAQYLEGLCDMVNNPPPEQ